MWDVELVIPQIAGIAKCQQLNSKGEASEALSLAKGDRPQVRSSLVELFATGLARRGPALFEGK